ncbi:MAG: class D beta-lactamase [Candidatus Omnitrophica bacterium]|nr:class D beta-lactamase [Candidatus Omnitrophota bacterium]
MKKIILLLCLIVSAPTFLNGQEIDKSLFQSYDTALVIYNRSSGELTDINQELSSRLLPPCSTFKIYNTLIGLEFGLITDAGTPWYKWDGVTRSIDGWNKDLTLREAFRVSCVPAFQILARRIGSERMKKYIEEINYGTKNISAGIDVFWLNPSEGEPVKISAIEQVELLNRLFDGNLPFSKSNIEILIDIMKVEQTDKGTLYGKTGSAMDANGKWEIGWFVGFLKSNDTTYVFACNITGGENPSGLVAREIVKNVFKSQGLL